MKYFKTILIALISSLSITGISFIDGKIWDVLFYVIGIVSYFIVGTLFSVGILHSKKAGSMAYVIVFLILAVTCFWFYRVLAKFRVWLLSIPLIVRIAIPSIFAAAIIGLIILNIVLKNRKKKENKTEIETLK